MGRASGRSSAPKRTRCGDGLRSGAQPGKEGAGKRGPMGTESFDLSGLRLLFGIAVFGGMIVLCIVGWSYGGAGGLIGGALGFLVRLGGRGLDWGERLGNGYIGA